MSAARRAAVSGHRRAAAEETHTAASASHKKAAQIRTAVGRAAALLAESQKRSTVARRPWAHPQTAERSFFSFFLSLCFPLAFLLVSWRGRRRRSTRDPEEKKKKNDSKKEESSGGKAKGCCRRGCGARGFKRVSTESRLAAPANEAASRRGVAPSLQMGCPSLFLFVEDIVLFFFIFSFCRVAPLGVAVCVQRRAAEQQVSRGQVGRTWRRRRRQAAWP